jgi:hypothetical protein
MKFQSFVAADIESALVGLKPETENNWGSTSFRAKLDAALRKKQYIPTDKPSNFTVKYSGSRAHSFDLVQTHMGCVVATAATAVAIPVPCTVRLTALDANDVEIAKKIATFTPKQECAGVSDPIACLLLGGKQEMGLVEFKGAFNRVVTVLVELVSSSFVDQLTFIIGFDNMIVVYH